MTDTPTIEREWLTCAETAKLVRAALKRELPGVRFSVRSHTYAGGASIDVRWTDGPFESEVDPIIRPYAGGGFDGMIDMAYSRTAWLNPDGTATFAATSGTEGSRGTVPEAYGSRTHPDARLVRFGADYVHGQREMSDEYRRQLEGIIEAETGEPFDGNRHYPLAVVDASRCEWAEPGDLARDERGGEWGYTLVHRLAQQVRPA